MKIPEVKTENTITLIANETAVVVVDMLNDFAHQDGSLFVPQAADTVCGIYELVKKAQKANVVVFFAEDEHEKDDPESTDWPHHAIKGTWGAKTVEELEVFKTWREAQTIKKLRFDAFYATDLEHRLRHCERTIKNVVIVGTVSHICCLFTAAGAGMRWIRPIIVRDCISSLPEFGEFEELAALHLVNTLFRGQIVATYHGVIFE